MYKNQFFIVTVSIDLYRNPCHPSPCGPNALCKDKQNKASCTCLRDYQGDPYIGCTPQCLMNNDCPKNKACLNKKCRDPCPGSCGVNAKCQVFNHNPQCTCLPSFTGNALVLCKEIVSSKDDLNFMYNYNFLTLLFNSSNRRT